MKRGYIRVSTREQNEARQVEAMLRAGVPKENLYIEKASGKNFIDRKVWQKLLVDCIIGDVIVVKELDRLGRNAEEIKDTFGLLAKKGVELQFLDAPMLDTAGKSLIEKELIQPIILHLLSYMAEQERKKMLERQREAYAVMEQDSKGRKISKRTGRAVGRVNKQENLTASQKAIIKSWIKKDVKLSECIQSTGLSEATLYRIKRTLKV